jgi:hypothetical protein
MESKAENNKWIILLIAVVVLVIWTWLAINNGSFLKAPAAPGVFLHLLAWLFVGALIRTHSQGTAPDARIDGIAILIGLLTLVVIWYLPSLFPDAKAKLSEYGFNLDVQKSPLVLWVAVAFLLGFYRRVTMMVPKVITNRIKKSLGINEPNDLKGNANNQRLSVWNGLKKLIGIK